MRDQVTNEKFGRLKRNLARAIDRPEDYSAIVELVQFFRVIIQAFFHNFRSSVNHLCTNQGIILTDLHVIVFQKSLEELKMIVSLRLSTFQNPSRENLNRCLKYMYLVLRCVTEGRC